MTKINEQYPGTTPQVNRIFDRKFEVAAAAPADAAAADDDDAAAATAAAEVNEHLF